MRLVLIIISLISWLNPIWAQSDFSIVPLSSLNSKKDDIACGMIEGKLVMMTTGEKDYVNDYVWNKHDVFHLESAIRGLTFSEWTKEGVMFDRKRLGDEGPASYDPTDSTIYFSSAENFGMSKNDMLKIYKMKYDGQTWGIPEMISICDNNADYTHPWFDPSQNLLVFSSNRTGGFGNMDIWYSYYVDSIGWTDPINPGNMVNTPYQEIFPTVFDGDIYYSTNAPGGLGGFDLKKALRADQWKSTTGMAAPFNSAGDDLNLIFLYEEKAIITSNREGGLGGDDIYLISKNPAHDDLIQYTARLEMLQEPLSGVTIAATNDYNELVMKEKSDSLGYVNIKTLELNKRYRLQLAGIDPSYYENILLVFYDHLGNRIREIRFNLSGFAELELLPLNYAALNLLPLEDQSILTIQIEGQLYEEVPGDMTKMEPITILDENGDPVALAYTNQAGKFRFTKLEPQQEYTFKLSQATAAKNVLITDRGDKITLPVLNAEVNYTRVTPDEAIELVNEYNEKITVSPKDLFVINRIYYEYNSARLTDEAKRQLEQLNIILNRNKEISIDIRSHTDSRGNDDYNLKLSEKRAQATVMYMSSFGIDKKRFTASGLGEKELLNECDDGVSCTDPEHSINRRTEIRLKKNPPLR
jgi:outer membrane protein OmpA-like peptidoglycan-associated protein